ncbi:MAG: hypothetical protein HQ564_05250 [Candidatus Saganbacteria bacterium]|nr:hypothetical protein [Candidatus Saganbacteria bacterium]
MKYGRYVVINKQNHPGMSYKLLNTHGAGKFAGLPSNLKTTVAAAHSTETLEHINRLSEKKNITPGDLQGVDYCILLLSSPQLLSAVLILTAYEAESVCAGLCIDKDDLGNTLILRRSKNPESFVWHGLTPTADWVRSHESWMAGKPEAPGPLTSLAYHSNGENIWRAIVPAPIGYTWLPHIRPKAVLGNRFPTKRRITNCNLDYFSNGSLRQVFASYRGKRIISATLADANGPIENIISSDEIYGSAGKKVNGYTPLYSPVRLKKWFTHRILPQAGFLFVKKAGELRVGSVGVPVLIQSSEIEKNSYYWIEPFEKEGILVLRICHEDRETVIAEVPLHRDTQANFPEPTGAFTLSAYLFTV